MLLPELVEKYLTHWSVYQHVRITNPAQSKYKDPGGALRNWRSGGFTPPRTGIIDAAKIIGCSEKELAMICYGADSQAAAIAAHQESRRADARERAAKQRAHAPKRPPSKPQLVAALIQQLRSSDNESLPALIAKCIPDGTSVNSHAIRDCGDHGYKSPVHVLLSWLRGINEIPAPKISRAAILIGCSERELAMTCFGAESQAAAIEKLQRAIADKENEARRIRYNSSATDREDHIKRNRERRAAQKAARIAAGGLSFRVMVRWGLMTEGERMERVRAGRRHYKRTVEKFRGGKITLDGQAVTIKEVLRELRSMRRRAERAILTLEQCAENLTKKPWLIHGFRTLAAWERSGDPRGMQAAEERATRQRQRWQITTHRRRAKEKSAAGDGIGLFQWIGVMKAWDYRCAYCGRHRSEVRDPARKMDLEIEHVVPMPLGPNSVGNIVPACKPCNSSKSDSDVTEWAKSVQITLSDRVMAIYRANIPETSHAKGE